MVSPYVQVVLKPTFSLSLFISCISITSAIGIQEEANEAVEKVAFLKTASSAGSRIGNYFLSLIFGSGNRAGLKLWRSFGDS